MTDQRYFEDVDPGDEFEEQILLDTPVVQRYLDVPGSRLGRASSRFNDPERAKQDGLPGAIVPGVMQLDLVSRLLSGLAGTAGKVRSVEVSFRRSVLHGDNLRALALVTDTVDAPDGAIVRLDVFLENERGERPLQGTADVELPRRA